MVRRFLRISFGIGLVVLVGMAGIAQFSGFVVVMSGLHISWDPSGLQLGHATFAMWAAERFPVGPWSAGGPIFRTADHS